jgi:hypothetical protein
MTRVQICNLALGWLGAGRISQLDESEPLSAQEEACASVFDSCVRTVLEAKAWTFATTRLALSPVLTSGLADRPYKVSIPTSVVRVLDVDDGSGLFDVDWRREGSEILLFDALDVVHARVITFEDDPTTYSPGFERALAARIAADVAGTLTENPALGERMESRYQFELSVGASRDAKQGSGDVRGSTWLRNSRS